MYYLHRKIVIFLFFLIGVFLLGLGIFLFFDEANTENTLKYVGGGALLIIIALLANKFGCIFVR